MRSSDGALQLAISMLRELGGAGGAGTNPEQLFAAGYAACFESALRLVARQLGKNVQDASITEPWWPPSAALLCHSAPAPEIGGRSTP